MPDLAIEIRDLHKSYGGVQAVRGIDLGVSRGEVFALLGPNGAGKTTTVEIMEGHRERTSGQVMVLGHDPAKRERALRRRIGIVLQETGIDRFLTVAEAIDMYRGYYPRPRAVDEIIEIVGLQAKRDSLVKRLSGGQQRRLDVAIGLAGDPELLFMDEPTTGFDPSARRNAWEMIRNLRDLGKTVFLTTHYMDEAQNLADRVGVIAEGRIVALGPPASLVGRGETATTISFTAPRGFELPEGLDAEVFEDRVSLSTTEPTRTLHALTATAIRMKSELRDLQVTRASLEDVYLELTQGQQGDEIDD